MRAGRGFFGLRLMTLVGAAVFPGQVLSAQGAVEFPHGTFPDGVGCMDCHTTEGWRPIQANPAFDHAQTTGFPLVGRHAAASCRTCHEDLHFEKASASPELCGTCHTDVHSGSLSTNCSLCHTPTAFRDVSGVRIHLTTGFALQGAHLQLSCESCHSTDEGGSFRPLSTDCLACHQEDYEAPKVTDHVALGFPAECLTCHTPRSWMDIGAFDHAVFSGGFQLQGAHKQAQCSSCHGQGGGLLFSPSGPDDCVACHQADYQRKHAGSGYPQTCATCHSRDSWDREAFDHSTVSGGFPLPSDHGLLACTNCHTADGTGTLFSPTSPTDCMACHQADYQEEHTGSGYPNDCTVCHSTNDWDGASTEHSTLSGGFGLVGDHGQLVCTSCHVPGGTETLFSPTTPDDCVACHQTDYQAQHTGSGYPTTCLSCHQVTTWDGAVVDHNLVSDGFALPSDHELLACTSCHTADGTGTLFNPTSPTDCMACHQADYQEEHTGSGYPNDCTVCHSTNDWDGASTEHSTLSGGFGLVGDHGQLVCNSCHVPGGTDPIFNPTAPDDCVACHQTDYQEEHTGSGYPTTCLSCHQVTTWDGAVVDHSLASGGFALPSDHQLLACTNCHTSDGTGTLFSPTSPGDCIACHQADYQEEHTGSGYPTDCTVCHSTNDWDGASTEHSTLSGGFDLVGDHGQLVCNSCHVPGGTDPIFNPTAPDDCVACHQTDYQAQHTGSGYPTTCLSCHQVTTWDGAVVDHNLASGGFALPSDHELLACTNCHTPDGTGTLFSPASPDDCMACHQADYQEEHTGSGYPNDCTVCHTTAGWPGATSDHSTLSGGFGLLGDHGLLVCTSCHIPGGTDPIFSPTSPDDCVACHQTDYQAQHTGSGYPTTCLSCHKVTTWDGAVVDHNLASGGFALPSDHELLACTNCHTPDGTGTLFSPTSTDDCMACHQADYQREHTGSGYPNDCTVCHTTSGWPGATSDHSTLSGGFGLLGDHGLLVCTSCHIPGGTDPIFSPTSPDDCVACHQTDYQAQHTGSGYPTTCLSCHQVTTWDGAVVDHNMASGGFALPSDHELLACTNCHTADGTGTLFSPTSPDDCMACHQADYQREHTGTGYPNDCTVCHTTSGWPGATTDHSTLSGGFGLLGDHGLLACTSCHVSGGTDPIFSPTAPDDCVACHQTDYQQQHTGSGYPTTCLSCHQVTTWDGAVVDHNLASGGFALPSDHELLACTNCHTPDGTGTLFSPTSPDDCMACHQADYQREHTGTGYPNDCTVCHTTAGWPGATTDHSTLSGGFGLLGDHGLLVCTNCHIPGGTDPIFSPTSPDDCLACHVGDFQREHSGSGYPTSCLSCHQVTNWDGAHFDHDGDYFPIFSGKHQGKWQQSCQTCHSNPADYSTFSCLNCHKHQKTDMDADHSEVSGYVYESGQCVSCHPTGNA